MRRPALAAGLTLLTASAAPQSREAGPLARVDRSLFDVSAAAGGDVYLWGPGEITARAPVPVPIDAEALHVSHGEMPPGGARRQAVAVDATVGRVSFFLSVQGKARLQVLDPAGTPLGAAPGVAFTETRHMLIASVTRPDPGSWTLVVEGRGLYSVSVRAGGAAPGGSPMIELAGVDFVRPGGRPGHEGWFRLQATPAAGARARARVDLSGPSRSVALAFVDAAGERLGDCQRLPAAVAEGAIAFDCRVPGQPFRFAVSGIDPSGARFQRATAALATPGQ